MRNRFHSNLCHSALTPAWIYPTHKIYTQEISSRVMPLWSLCEVEMCLGQSDNFGRLNIDEWQMTNSGQSVEQMLHCLKQLPLPFLVFFFFEAQWCVLMHLFGHKNKCLHPAHDSEVIIPAKVIICLGSGTKHFNTWFCLRHPIVYIFPLPRVYSAKLPLHKAIYIFCMWSHLEEHWYFQPFLKFLMSSALCLAKI